jgi:choline transporter-like protein 2/4/5
MVCAWCIFSRHLGSIAFGAAILTIMTIIRMILAAIDYYTKEYQASNLALKIAMKCVQCCVWCFDQTVKFITYYGYIFVAIEGASFCSACWSTFSIIFKYPAQMSVNALVSKLLSVIISLSIPTSCTALGFIWIGNNSDSSSPVYSAIAIFFLSYVIAICVTDVFKCCVDTIFVCSFKDMEENKPPKFMTEELRDGFGLKDVEPDPKRAEEAKELESKKPKFVKGSSKGNGPTISQAASGTESAQQELTRF